MGPLTVSYVDATAGKPGLRTSSHRHSLTTHLDNIALGIGCHVPVTKLYDHVLDALRKLSLCCLVDSKVTGLTEHER
jgi:hypothetical protein